MSPSRFLAVVALAGAVVAAAPGRAQAFCGFFVAGSDAKLTNNATQVVLMRKGNRTVLSMSNTYQGPPENFAMVVPVPVVLQKEDVKTLPADVFDRVDSLSAPRLVEYWEQDPCQPTVRSLRAWAAWAWREARGAERQDGERPRREDRGAVHRRRVPDPDPVGEGLDRARDLAAARELQHPAGRGRGAGARTSATVEVLRRQGRHQEGEARRAGRRAAVAAAFPFDANELRLPVRLGLLNAAGKQDLIVNVIHPTSRYEVANYANTFIPTNLEVADGVRNNFAAFYAELFDATVEKMGRKVVVTEYAWQTTGCDPCPAPPLSPTISRRWPRRPRGASRRAGRLDAPRGGCRRRPVVGADAAARPLQQGDAVRGSDLPRGEAGDGRARQLERHQRRRGRQREPTADGGVNNFQGRYIIRHYWNGPVACKKPAYDQLGRPARQPRRASDADRGQGAGDRAAREGGAQDRGALAGAAARHRRQAAAAAEGRRHDRPQPARRAGSGASAPRWSSPASALIARGSAPSRAPLPRFEPHGRDVGVALGIEEGPSNDEVAAEVARQGFYAGAPVGSGDCIGCHRDVAAQWASSAHRFSSFNNPYYRVATDAFREEKGAVASRFCGNCHEPFLVATGAMDRPIQRGTRAAQAGVTCLVCHSIAHVDREGNGRYEADLRPVPTRRARTARGCGRR